MATPKTNPAPKKHQFISTMWKLAVLKFSERWPDPTTGIRGSAFFIVPDGNRVTAEATDGKSQLVLLKGDTRTQDPNRVTQMLQVYGGKDVYEQLPKEAYINIDPNYEGGRFMTIEDFEDLCAQHKIPLPSSTSATSSAQA